MAETGTGLSIPIFDDVLAAHERVKPYIHCTPVLTSTYLNDLTGAELFFKCENFQKAGAFKVRGACNAVFGLEGSQAEKGVATHSSGNHGLSLSYAAGRRGIPATVVMPRTAPEAKKAAVRGYGGRIVECEPSTSSREAVFAEVIAETGAEFVHPYNDPRVIAGQATCSRELLDQVEKLDAVMAPIGGGGMISGTCLTLSNIAPNTEIFAAEPEQADDAYRSFKAGHIIADDAPQTIADGLKVPLKELTWHFVKNHVTDILTASEDEIVEAMKITWQRMKIVMEPSCAVPLATIIRNKDRFAGKRVGVILTGGNVDLENCPGTGLTKGKERPMSMTKNPADYEVGYDIPAAVGMDEADIQTPCLVLDLDALERNIKKMGQFAKDMGVRHRVHGKMHKSVDVAKLQAELGGSCGVCCQKVSEAEAFVRGGIKDILVSNQVCDPAKIDRLVRIPKRGARTICCVDDVANVADLSAATQKHGTEIECLVEIDCGAGRCGVTTTEAVLEIARAIHAAPGLTFSGLQAYQGAMQHMDSYEDRKQKIDIAVAMVADAVNALKAEGLECDIVGGGGTGSYYFEGNSGVYNELQCGSYAFMDADYGRILDKDGNRIDRGEWENSLFILTSVMSHAKADKAICDAGLKAQSVDSGLPTVFGRDDVEYVKCSDEHGVIADPNGVLKVNDKLKLVPGHCDPTCNVHDWYIGVRGGKVEKIWPVTARGLAY